jgi:Protein of unknown function (DUF3592)
MRLIVWVFGGFAVLVGLVSVINILRGFFRLGTSRRLTASGIAAAGLVVDNKRQTYQTPPTGNGQPGRVSTMFQPVIRFTTQQGQEITAVSPAQSNRSFRVGTAVAIRYDAANPNVVQIASGRGKGSGGCGMIVGGAFGIIVAVVILAVVASQQR